MTTLQLTHVYTTELQPSVSSYGKKGSWSEEKEKKESKEEEACAPRQSVFLPCLLTYSREVYRCTFACLGCVSVHPCVCVFFVGVLLSWLWSCGQEGPQLQMWAGQAAGNRAAHCTGRTGCNLIQYPAITEPHCLLSLPDPPKHSYTPQSPSHRCAPSFHPSPSFPASFPAFLSTSPEDLWKVERLFISSIKQLLFMMFPFWMFNVASKCCSLQLSLSLLLSKDIALSPLPPLPLPLSGVEWR